MSTVLRFLFVIPIGFVAAVMTAAFAMLWPFLDAPRGITGVDPVFLFHTGIAFFAQAAQIGSVVLVPWALFMVATELFALSSIVLHIAAGIIGGVAIIVTAYGGSAPHMSVQTAIVVASLCFALAYWIVAGRTAGRWRRRGTQPSADGASEG
ncbi:MULTISPECIES: hypothetical protein [Aurantimonas]|uniref:hypothetical protein n=1 Tax=Aurantimonas TaxID=182269 RepID=UPI0035112667